MTQFARFVSLVPPPFCLSMKQRKRVEWDSSTKCKSHSMCDMTHIHMCDMTHPFV